MLKQSEGGISSQRPIKRIEVHNRQEEDVKRKNRSGAGKMFDRVLFLLASDEDVVDGDMDCDDVALEGEQQCQWDDIKMHMEINNLQSFTT